MNNNASPLNLSDYLTIGEASETLGVTRATLRNWDKAGKLKPYRHPVNGYRLYKRIELDALLKKVNNENKLNDERP